MKSLLTVALVLASVANASPSNESPREALLQQLQKVQAGILDSKTNLQTSQKNLETIETEMETLKRLETEHVQLKADVHEQISNAAAKEKGKAKENFLRRANKLEADVHRQLGEIRSRFAPLENERMSWSERKAKYETALGELTKKESALNERLATASAPSTGGAPETTPGATEAAPQDKKPETAEPTLVRPASSKTPETP